MKTKQISYYVVMSLITMTQAQSRVGHIYGLAFLDLEMATEQLDLLQIAIASDNKVARVAIYQEDLQPWLTVVLDQSNNYMKNISTVHGDFHIPISGSTSVIHGRRMFYAVSDQRLFISSMLSTQGTGDGFLALPVTDVSTDFYAMSYGTDQNSDTQFRSVITIVGFYNGTCFEVWRRNENGSDELYKADSVHDGEVVIIASATEDFTGYRIISGRPIAVTTGHECAEVPIGTRYCDNLYSQVPPVVNWGKEFVITPILGRDPNSGYTVRILASEDDTEIHRFNKVTSAFELFRVLDRARYVDIKHSRADEAILFKCNKPCQVAQYGHGNKAETVYTNMTEPDPFMSLVPPTSKYENRMIFATFNKYGVKHNYYIELMKYFLCVVVHKDQTNGVQLNGAVFAPGVNWNFIGDYAVKGAEVPHGFHTLSHSDATVQIMGFLVGHAMGGLGKKGLTSYGHSTGYAESLRPAIDHHIFATVNLPAAYVRPENYRELTIVDIAQTKCDSSILNIADPGPELSVNGRVNASSFSHRCRDADGVIQNIQKEFKAMADKMKADLKQMICESKICRAPTDRQSVDVDVKSVSLELNNAAETYYIDDVFMKVVLVASLDTTMLQAILCKTEIENYVFDLTKWSKDPVVFLNEACDRPIVEYSKTAIKANTNSEC